MEDQNGIAGIAGTVVFVSSKFQVPSFRFQVPGSKFQIPSNFLFRGSGYEFKQHETRNSLYCILNTATAN